MNDQIEEQRDNN